MLRHSASRVSIIGSCVFVIASCVSGVGTWGVIWQESHIEAPTRIPSAYNDQLTAWPDGSTSGQCHVQEAEIQAKNLFLRNSLPLPPSSTGTYHSSNSSPYGVFLLILCICIKKGVWPKWTVSRSWGSRWERQKLGRQLKNLRKDFCKILLVNDLYSWNSTLALDVSWVFPSSWNTPPS